ncbi:MAG: response regulator [Nostoc sp.]|uniref:response regulator n=1 Tax=Nostoc sp. TaxID=1180 RepID=UPI002FF4D942
MSQQQRTVLIVDDSPEDRELYRQFLLREREYSYTILEATLGQLGLELWQQYQPDVVLLDYRLPDLDGLEFLAQLQPSTQQLCLPVIVITGHGNEEIAVQAMKAGAQDYLLKEQITPERLQTAVNGTIATVQLRTQLQQRIERERVVTQITRQIHQSQNLDEILQTTVVKVRQFLHTDRVLVFQLKPDGNGTVVAESVGSEWRSLLSSTMYDPCLAENYIASNLPKTVSYDSAFVESYIERYRQGYVTAIFDIHNSNIDPCHVELLAQFQVQANLVVPIVQDNQFWGLLIAHHCASPRFWKPLEIDLLKELAIQVSIALRQAELYQQAQRELKERQQVEAQLRQSEEQLRLGMQIAGFALARFDYASNTVELSPEAAALYGLPVHELVVSRKRIHATFHPEEQAKLAQLIEQILDPAGSGWFACDHRVVWADGNVRWLSVRKQTFFDPTSTNERPIYAILAAVDITERKLVEQEREQLLEKEQLARAEAERANRIKDEFLAVLSHELRSPLNPILGWTKLLQTGRLDQTKTAEALATIERNAKLQTKLIDDLLDVAKIIRGKLSINANPVNLAFVIESAIDTVRTTVVAKSIVLHPVLPNIGQVYGDSNRLQQIVWNLLSNAIKFTPNRGRVEIQLQRVDEQAQIVVSDTGIGIDPEFLPHIFESFRQENTSITRKYGGLGLGLAIVRQLVEVHGGTITADSPGVGLGATFIVRLPLLNVQPEIRQIDELSQPGLELTGIRVLTVDDDPDARELLTVLLTEYGAEVLTVASAAEVLANLESFRPDVLVSDIGMPEVDGYSLIQQIRTLPPEKGGEIPAIALTAYARVDDYEQAITSGYQRHVIKPLDPEELLQALLAITQTKPNH